MDLTDLESVRRFAAAVKALTPHVHLLLNNAGVNRWERCTDTPHTSMEPFFRTNHLGHFALTALLLDRVAACDGKVINTASIAHIFAKPMKQGDPMIDFDKLENFDMAVAKALNQRKPFYSVSKLCNVLFTRELARRLSAPQRAVPDSGAATDGPPLRPRGRREASDAAAPRRRDAAPSAVGVYAVHPGLVNTQMVEHMALWAPLRRVVFKTWRAGAATQLYLCAESKARLTNGGYYAAGRLLAPSSAASCPRLAQVSRRRPRLRTTTDQLETRVGRLSVCLSASQD
eukprot:Selendium_serpulae@DN5744_c3_g1_i2.p2